MMVTKADSQGGVRVITLNRPDRLNAIVPELVTDLLSMLTEAANDETVRAVILRGAGRAFCSGDDLQNETGTLAQTQAFVEGIQDVSRAILLGPKPVVAAVHGWAVGGGLEWVMNCDFAVCSDETRFFFPEVSLGLFPTGGATSILPRLVGLQRARELMLFGEQFDAQQAHDWGLIWNVVPEDSLLDAATKGLFE